MFSAFSKGFSQLSDPALRRVVWIGVGAAAAVFALLWGGVAFVLANLALFDVGWLNTLVGFAGGLGALLLTWLLFPTTVSVVIGLFLEDVAHAVEAKHYPGLAAPRPQPVGEMLRGAAKFLGISLALNLLMLPFLLFPPVFPFVFYGVNGYLLSRESFELVALRRVDAATAKAMRSAYQGRLVMIGAATALMLTVPVLNLIAPVVATAAMVHLFEGRRTRGKKE